MKEKVIKYLESLGFITVSHKSSVQQVFSKENIIVIVEDKSHTKD
jgi:hypothetical protein